MMSELRLLDKTFSPYLNADEIALRVKHLAEDLERDYASRKVLFVSVLNGAFMFTSDLMKALDLSLEISFIKVSSYEGMASTGKVKEIIGLKNSVEGRHVIVLEDIVDTGTTAEKVLGLLNAQNPASLEICTLLFKKSEFKGNTPPKYVGFEIPNKFVVGYGLDYDESGRNLSELYQLKE
tara:strand:- start:6530 stop:7069 length:540 start_codon:yes stop_codon:yes gene_type:complete